MEGLEELAEISLRGKKNAQAIKGEIIRLTEGAMNGTIPFAQALRQRIDLLDAKRDDLEALAAVLKQKVTPSFVRNKSLFRDNPDHIYIVSSGFREFIEPVVTPFGIKPEHILANSFTYDTDGNIVGCDETNPLSQDRGKVEVLRRLGLKGRVMVVGDGYTDYEIKEAGEADTFFAFTENIHRSKVVRKADAEAKTLDEFLFLNKLPQTLSYPKNRINVLVLENIHPIAVEKFTKEGYTIEIVKGGLDEDELCEKIENVSILCIRSKTIVTGKVLERAKKLIAVGAFCIGTNQIDLRGCQERGIAVFNAPYSNTRSVVELAIGEMIVLMRNIPEKNRRLHVGEWDKSAGNSYEVRGKTLGLIGYGSIGTQLSVLAEALGMKVVFYDIVDKLALGNAKKADSLHDMLAIADVVSVHVDGRRENYDLIGEEEFGTMKKGAIFLNLARGHVVSVPALVAALRSGHLGGAGVDVFPYEPKTNDEPFVSDLQGIPNVIITPHIGGSTAEAQENIGTYVPEKMIEYVNTGGTFASVNFPNLQLPHLKNAHRFIHVHQNVPGILASINSTLAASKINIVGQYLKTNDAIGYVITDVETEYDQEVLKQMRDVPHTIKFRVLY